MARLWKSLEFRLVLGALLSGILLIILFVRIYPESSIRIPLSREQIRHRAESLLDSLGYDMGHYRIGLQMAHQEDLVRAAQQQYGSGTGLRMLSDSLYAWWWECQWHPDRAASEDTNVVVVFGDPHVLRDNMAQMSLTPDGRPLSFQIRAMEDTSAALVSGHPEIQDAVALFCMLHADTAQWERIQADTPPKAGPGGPVKIRWRRAHPVADMEIRFSVDTLGDRIISFQTETMAAQKADASDKSEEIISILSFLLVYMLFVVLGIVFLIKRLRADLVDLTGGLIPGIIVMIAWTVMYWHSIGHQKFWEILLGYFLTTPFVGGAVWVLYALGESYTREVWAHKLRIVDQIHRRFASNGLGKALIRGILLGFPFLALHAVIWALQVNLLHGYLSLGDRILALWSSAVPSLLAVSETLMSVMLITISVCLFYLSLLRRYTRSRVWMILMACLVFSMICPPIGHCAAIWHRIPVNCILGLFLIAVFMRFEIVTTMMTLFSASLVYRILVFVHCGDPFFQEQAFIIMGLWVLLAAAGVWLLFRSGKADESSHYIPDYLRRVYHRQELKRELEIARDVQLNFLPLKNPVIQGLDVASFCMPAREVGGDYFDFINLGDKKLGVVIGDVSGKGIPAAFYMTLTKGLLKSQAASHASPRDVLIRLNRLFFENAKRGIFISLIYAVFDLTEMKLTFARAGHNPMILHCSNTGKTSEVCPAGMAIGFESGDIFEKTIQEVTLPLHPGDVTFFYTDGLNEAQNLKLEEYGETRLQNNLAETAHLTSERVMEHIKKKIQAFTAGAEQHDDMTAVLVKIC
ncbi:PP2C family protein-serine/threonine phosphatase [bacterium]|nr:PP2C family protein-serine/threonine phosphatase [bacterium]